MCPQSLKMLGSNRHLDLYLLDVSNKQSDICSSTCLNGGTCQSASCQCRGGYAGDFCQVDCFHFLETFARLITFKAETQHDLLVSRVFKYKVQSTVWGVQTPILY